MKRSLLAATAMLLISTAAASAAPTIYEAQCDAPVLTIGDDPRDHNPVTEISVLYTPTSGQWNVFHTLTTGYVVERSEQYLISDQTGGNIVRWQGTLIKNRNIVMVGELTRNQSGIVYSERQYDRNRLIMSMSTHCVQVTQQAAPAPAPVRDAYAYAPMVFQVPYDVSQGHMNIRNGPGVNHGLTGAIPAGQIVRASRCVPRDDGVAGADWCLVNWNGYAGWVSQAGLMPVQ